LSETPEHTQEISNESSNHEENDASFQNLSTLNENADEDDLSQSDDDATDDVWVSSEDIFTAMSSPYYQSAAEDEEELNGMKSKLLIEN